MRANFTTLIGCYAEEDLRPGRLDGVAWAIGGNLSADRFAEHVVIDDPRPSFSDDYGRCKDIYRPGFNHKQLTGFFARSPLSASPLVILSDIGPNFCKLLLGNASGQRVFGFEANDDPESVDLKYGSSRTGWWEFSRQSVVYFAMSGVTVVAPDGPNRLAFPNGYYIGGRGVGAPARARLLRRLRQGSNIFDDDDLVDNASVGDLVDNESPTLLNAGTNAEQLLIGWAYTESGLPGVPPAWRQRRVMTENTSFVPTSIEQSIAVAASPTFNVASGETIKFIRDQNNKPTFADGTPGQRMVPILTHDATDGPKSKYSFTWPPNVTAAGGTASILLTNSPNAVDVFVLLWDNASSRWRITSVSLNHS